MYHIPVLMVCITTSWFDTQEHVLRMRTFQNEANYLQISWYCKIIIVGWLVVLCFTSRSRIFHLYGDVTITGEGLQDYNESRLKSSFRKFYGRYNDLVCDYKLSLAHMLNNLLDCHFHTGLDDGLSRTPNFDKGRTADVTGQQGMLTPPQHLILLSHLSKVRVALHSNL